MKKTIFVRELTPGQVIDELFVLSDARQAMAKNGPYWMLKLQDNTGQIEARIWSPYSADYPSLASGAAVVVKGQVESFRDQLQVRVENLVVLDADQEIQWADLVPASERPPRDMLEELEKLCRDELTYKPWRSLVKKVLADPEIRKRLLVAPAGKNMHHAYLGGLIEHTLSVSRLVLNICESYPTLDREILLTAAVLHDLGKAWEISSGPTREYTDEGKLMGHILITLEVLEPFFKKTKDLDPGLLLHLKHLLLSHHGEYEFGSPRLPQTAEALVLHFADNIDAKMNAVGMAVGGEDDPEQAWSEYLKPLARSVYRAKSTPSPGNRQDNPSEGQCLLPLKE